MGNSKKAIFYPSADAEVVSYYDNAVKNLVKLASKYGVSADLLTTLNNYNSQILTVKQKSDADQQIAKAGVKAKENLFAHAKTDLLRELKRVTDLADFNEADAMALGIRRESGTEDLTQTQAIISGLTVLPGQVIIDWVKGKMDGVAVYTSLDGTNFKQIGMDLRSPYEDKRPNQTAGQPEVRHYRLRYLKGDEQVGQYSDVINTTVLI